jgi:hypothetical protein
VSDVRRVFPWLKGRSRRRVGGCRAALVFSRGHVRARCPRRSFGCARLDSGRTSHHEPRDAHARTTSARARRARAPQVRAGRGPDTRNRGCPRASSHRQLHAHGIGLALDMG